MNHKKIKISNSNNQIYLENCSKNLIFTMIQNNLLKRYYANDKINYL